MGTPGCGDLRHRGGRAVGGGCAFWQPALGHPESDLEAGEAWARVMETTGATLGSLPRAP